MCWKCFSTWWKTSSKTNVIFTHFDNLKKFAQFVWIVKPKYNWQKRKWHDVWPSMESHSLSLCSSFNPGQVGGSVPFSRVSPQSWYWGWMGVLVIHSHETLIHDLWVPSPTLSPLGHNWWWLMSMINSLSTFTHLLETGLLKMTKALQETLDWGITMQCWRIKLEKKTFFQHFQKTIDCMTTEPQVHFWVLGFLQPDEQCTFFFFYQSENSDSFLLFLMFSLVDIFNSLSLYIYIYNIKKKETVIN